VLGRRLKTAATEESSVKTDNRINITAFWLPSYEHPRYFIHWIFIYCVPVDIWKYNFHHIIFNVM
jgi:hypothetical protein